MDAYSLLEEYKRGIDNGQVKSLAPLLPIFNMGGTSLNLKGREPMVPIFDLAQPKRMTMMAGRQVSKSWSLAEKMILLPSFIAGFKAACVEPRWLQKKRFNSQILVPLLQGMECQDSVISKKQIELVDEKTFKSGGKIILINGFRSADSSRGASANWLGIDEIQDILNNLVPVFESITDAHTEDGFRLYSGTAKTSDSTLALKFEESSQGHWCIKCPSCGRFNIAAPDEQLLMMIGDTGCSCAFCRHKLPVEQGEYIHRYPSRIYTHIGFHLPQIIFGFHQTEQAWTEILYKKNNWSKTQFYNECLGIPDDESVRLLTKEDLLNARNNIHTKQEGINVKDQYGLRVLSVDWGGGGGGDSATGLAVIAKNSFANHLECLYINRLPQGLTPEQEVAAVERLAEEFEVDYIAHDYTGAGFIREALFLSKCPQWTGRMYPISYSYRPTSDLVTYSQSGSRASYVVDKTKSLLLTINSIRHKALLVPWFDAKDGTAPQLDFLSIIEHAQDIGEGVTEKNTVQRASTVYLLDKVAGKKDDAAQAVNIGFIAICNITKTYPVLTFDNKYEMTDEQVTAIFGEE